MTDIYALNKAYYERNFLKYEKASWYYFNKYKSNMVNYELKTCLKNIPKIEDMAVLEIGPGTGYLTDKLLKLTKKRVYYTAIEHSKNMIEVLMKRCASRCASFNAINESVNGSTLPQLLAEKKFDMIIGSSILHHILDYEQVVEILVNHLNEHGVLYILREPLHKSEILKSTYFSDLLDSFYSSIQHVVMHPRVVGLLWPAKLKAEPCDLVGLQAFQDGVSTKPFRSHRILFFRKYNRRTPLTFLSYLENKWLGQFRKDRFGDTWFSICIKK